MLELRLVKDRMPTVGARGVWSGEVVDVQTQKVLASTDYERTPEDVAEVVRTRFALTTLGIILEG